MTFGCSGTKYRWPTWADIVLRNAELEGLDTDNWGVPGAGNLFIAIQIQHAIATGLLKAGDHAFVCWTTFPREDRLVNGKWITPGNIFNQSSNQITYPNDWVEKFADPEFYTIRDCSLINATRHTLDQLGIKQTVFSLDWEDVNYNGINHITNTVEPSLNKILSTFKLKFDCNSIFKVLGRDPLVTIQVKHIDGDGKVKVYNDSHHHPTSMLNYVKQELCTLNIQWLTTVRSEVESWVYEWDTKLKTATQPISKTDFPTTPSKNKQWRL